MSISNKLFKCLVRHRKNKLKWQQFITLFSNLMKIIWKNIMENCERFDFFGRREGSTFLWPLFFYLNFNLWNYQGFCISDSRMIISSVLSFWVFNQSLVSAKVNPAPSQADTTPNSPLKTSQKGMNMKLCYFKNRIIKRTWIQF